ncbi:MAG: TetR/AcrR family transcriptional regulator [Acidobacteriota bacterium]|nr:TetR/AcrR family transcriptional regulator [Blastocatellia bacterium]MDW8411117.1 TetR/AcrR family transcriptional regulator [Acidobacteriota bacterium]
MARTVSPENEAARKQQIVSAAHKVFIKKDYSRVRIEDIAKQANLSKGAVLYYFGTKEKVFLALFEWLTQLVAQRIENAVASTDDPLEQLNRLVEQAFESAKLHRAFFRIYLDCLGQGSRKEKYAKINRAFYQACHQVQVNIVENGKRKGVFRPDLNAVDASRVTRAVLEGLGVQWLYIGTDEDLKDYGRLAREAILRYHCCTTTTVPSSDRDALETHTPHV